MSRSVLLDLAPRQFTQLYLQWWRDCLITLAHQVEAWIILPSTTCHLTIPASSRLGLEFSYPFVGDRGVEVIKEHIYDLLVLHRSIIVLNLLS